MWKLKGFQVDAFDPTIIVYNIWANSEIDLPSTMTDIGYGTALGFGSTAQTFDDSKEWRWNGTEWVEQTDGQQIEISADDIVYDNTSSGMTATNVQDAIDETHALDDMQDRALAELYGMDATQQLEILKNRACIITQMDIGGAKNTIDAQSFTSQTKNGITLTKNADDSFTISGTFTSRVTSYFTIDSVVGVESTVLAFDGGESGIYAYARNGNPASWLTSDGGVPITTGVPIPAQNVGASFDIAIMVNNSDGRFDNRVFDKTVRVMICKAADYNISPAFVPYAPTNRELYEMILALQSGRSVQSVNQISSLNSPLNLSRNDLNESLDTNFDLLDSIPEEEEGEEDV